MHLGLYHNQLQVPEARCTDYGLPRQVDMAVRSWDPGWDKAIGVDSTSRDSTRR